MNKKKKTKPAMVMSFLIIKEKSWQKEDENNSKRRNAKLLKTFKVNFRTNFFPVKRQK